MTKIKDNLIINKDINNLYNSTQNIIMNNNLTTNNIINSLTFIADNNNDDENIAKVDINKIVVNAKNDKRFHKLLTLCIKYDIHLFNQYNDMCTMLSVNNLIEQTNMKKKKLISDLSDNIIKINNNANNNNLNELFIDIDNSYTLLKKKYKELEIIFYVLTNVYTDVILENLCCIITSVGSSSQNNSSIENSKIKKNKEEKCKEEKDKDKYIAIYSN